MMFIFVNENDNEITLYRHIFIIYNIYFSSVYVLIALVIKMVYHITKHYNDITWNSNTCIDIFQILVIIIKTMERNINKDQF